MSEHRVEIRLVDGRVFALVNATVGEFVALLDRERITPDDILETVHLVDADAIRAARDKRFES